MGSEQVKIFTVDVSDYYFSIIEKLFSKTMIVIDYLKNYSAIISS